MLKPHRILINRFSGYADEAAAFMRRRRHGRRPFVRLHFGDGRSVDCSADPAAGELIAVSERLIELAGRSPVAPEEGRG